MERARLALRIPSASPTGARVAGGSWLFAIDCMHYLAAHLGASLARKAGGAALANAETFGPPAAAPAGACAAPALARTLPRRRRAALRVVTASAGRGHVCVLAWPRARVRCACAAVAPS